MNEFLLCRRDCFISIKAFQNVRAALYSFERLCALVNSKDDILVSSFFYMGVIRYAKPFLRARSSSGFLIYPISQLKKRKDFSLNIHNHIIEIRNTLIAHDDFEQIEPRILSFGIKPEGLDITIPTSVTIANKCISHLADLGGALRIKEHISNVFRAIQDKLSSDIKRFREISIKRPEQAKEAERHSKNYGKVHIPIGGKHLNPPDFMNDEWLNPVEPDFSEVHSGFRYENIKARMDFWGPESIKLPNGDVHVITPTTNERT